MKNKQKPNFIFFFSDQQRWDTCGCYGQPLNVTPNLDDFASKNVLFTSTYTCQPVCGPARACLQTGKYATETGCFRNDIGLPVDEKTIANHFAENGYKVGYIGKWHLASNYSDFSGSSIPQGVESRDYKTKPIPIIHRGGWKDQWIASDLLEFTSHSYDGYLFDRENNKKMIPNGSYRADALTDWAIETVDEWAGQDEPFFLFLSFLEPHHQNDHNHYEGPEGSKEKFSLFSPPGDLQNLEGDWNTEYPDYLGAVNNLDANFGRIVNYLEERGLMESTYIIYTSDHGSHFRTRNKTLGKGCFDDYKRTCHEAATHIPLVIGGAASSKGYAVEDLVSLIDIPPTLLSLAGIDVPATFSGFSLTPCITGEENTARREHIFIQISESQVGRAIRTKEWCYCISAKDKNGWDFMNSVSYEEVYLYDLKKDPFELNNLIHDADYKTVREDLRCKLIEEIILIEKYQPAVIPASPQ
jgi:arylsulfatase A-like enzyme